MICQYINVNASDFRTSNNDIQVFIKPFQIVFVVYKDSAKWSSETLSKEISKIIVEMKAIVKSDI